MWLFIEDQRSGAFLYAMLCGFFIGALYDIFRVLRTVWRGSRIRLFCEDVVFCVISALVFTVFCFNISLGIIRLFLALGALMGFFVYRFSVGLLTVRVAAAIKALLMPYVFAVKRFIGKTKLRLYSLCYTRARIYGVCNAFK